MASKNRNKGNYHENKILDWLQEIGFKAKKQPLSGQLGGEYRGDILIEVGGHDLVVEVKYRDKGSFPSAFTVMEERDMAVFKRKTGDVKQVVIIDADVFEKVIAPRLVDGTPKPRRKARVPDDWTPSESLRNDINLKLKEDINHDDETNRFRDHHISRGTTFANYDLAYRNWCRNSIKFRSTGTSSSTFAGGQKPKHSGQKPSFFAGINNRLSSD